MQIQFSWLVCLTEVIVVEKRKILDANELGKIAEKCVNLNSNLMVFGLPFSGKSSLAKAICKKSKQFVTLEEEEIMEEKNGLAIKKDIGNKRWAVGHQFPGMNENVSDGYLEKFLVENMGLDTTKWTIIRIKTK